MTKKKEVIYVGGDGELATVKEEKAQEDLEKAKTQWVAKKAEELKKAQDLIATVPEDYDYVGVNNATMYGKDFTSKYYSTQQIVLFVYIRQYLELTKEDFAWANIASVDMQDYDRETLLKYIDEDGYNTVKIYVTLDVRGIEYMKGAIIHLRSLDFITIVEPQTNMMGL